MSLVLLAVGGAVVLATAAVTGYVTSPSDGHASRDRRLDGQTGGALPVDEIKRRFTGSVCQILTPFDCNNGSVDADGVRAQVGRSPSALPNGTQCGCNGFRVRACGVLRMDVGRCPFVALCSPRFFRSNVPSQQFTPICNSNVYRVLNVP